jgi:RNA polymerase sigma factor (sigma-70 family)
VTVPLEEDRSWCAAFKRGDRGALERVFRFYAPHVARFVRAQRFPEHDVESVVHEVFVKAFAAPARASWDGVRPFGAWLTTMTRNWLIDHARKHKRVLLLAPEDMPVRADDKASPERAAEHGVLVQVLDGFRAGLSVDEAALFDTRFAQEQSIRAAAHTLGWSEIRARKYDTALRSRLLECLRAAGFLQHVQIRIGQSLMARKPQEEEL